MANVLVTGAGGHLGRRVVELLIEAKAGHIIATTRNPEKLADLAARGVEVRPADFDDLASLATAFRGAERLLLISTDVLDKPGRRLRQHRSAVAAAANAGVGHIVYTSCPAPHPAPESTVIDDHFWTEQAIFRTDMDWTILRNNIYAEIILRGLPHAIASGKLFTATGAGGRSYVTREDCARTAAAAVAGGAGHNIFDVTGPAAVTQTELAVIAATLAGSPVEHVSVDAASLKSGMIGAGLPSFLADVLVAFDVAAARGYHAIVTPTVERLTGRAPASVRDFLTANRAALKPD